MIIYYKALEWSIAQRLMSQNKDSFKYKEKQKSLNKKPLSWNKHFRINNKNYRVTLSLSLYNKQFKKNVQIQKYKVRSKYQTNKFRISKNR